MGQLVQGFNLFTPTKEIILDNYKSKIAKCYQALNGLPKVYDGNLDTNFSLTKLLPNIPCFIYVKEAIELDGSVGAVEGGSLSDNEILDLQSFEFSYHRENAKVPDGMFTREIPLDGFSALVENSNSTGLDCSDFDVFFVDSNYVEIDIDVSDTSSRSILTIDSDNRISFNGKFRLLTNYKGFWLNVDRGLVFHDKKSNKGYKFYHNKYASKFVLHRFDI